MQALIFFYFGVASVSCQAWYAFISSVANLDTSSTDFNISALPQ